MDKNEEIKADTTINHHVSDQSHNWTLSRITDFGVIGFVLALLPSVAVICYTILSVVKTILDFASIGWNQ